MDAPRATTASAVSPMTRAANPDRATVPRTSRSVAEAPTARRSCPPRTTSRTGALTGVPDSRAVLVGAPERPASSAPRSNRSCFPARTRVGRFQLRGRSRRVILGASSMKSASVRSAPPAAASRATYRTAASPRVPTQRGRSMKLATPVAPFSWDGLDAGRSHDRRAVRLARDVAGDARPTTRVARPPNIIGCPGSVALAGASHSSAPGMPTGRRMASGGVAPRACWHSRGGPRVSERSGCQPGAAGSVRGGGRSSAGSSAATRSDGAAPPSRRWW